MSNADNAFDAPIALPTVTAPAPELTVRLLAVLVAESTVLEKPTVPPPAVVTVVSVATLTGPVKPILPEEVVV